MSLFTVSNQQLEQLGDAAEEKFVRSMAEFLREQVPGTKEETEDSVLAFVRVMVRKAKSYQLQTKRDVSIYVVSAALLGPNFEEHFRPAKAMLTSDAPAPDKAAWLQDATVALIDSKGKVQ